MSRSVFIPLGSATARHRRVFFLTLCLSGLALGLTNQGCNRRVAQDGETKQQENADDSKTNSDDSSTGGALEGAPAREVNAAWYDVPVGSLAKRRAGMEEFTAAHNRLPLGTLVRVTHLANGKTVTVRITDRGITNRKIKLDLCKEAAHELGMLSKGVARVRMQILPDEDNGAPAVSNTSALQN